MDVGKGKCRRTTWPGCRTASKLWPCTPAEPRVLPGGSAFDGLQPPPSHPAFGVPVLGLEPGPGSRPCSGLTPLLGRLDTSTAHCLSAACCPPAPHPLDPGHQRPPFPQLPSLAPCSKHATLAQMCPSWGLSSVCRAEVWRSTPISGERLPGRKRQGPEAHSSIVFSATTGDLPVPGHSSVAPRTPEWRPPRLHLSVGRLWSLIPALRFT